MHDLAIITISTNEANWLRPCLSTIFEKQGDISLDVVVADNMSTDGTRELVETEFPQARVVTCANHGFSHANNRALMTCDARWILFINPDTEIVDGTLADLVHEVDARPDLGLVGVRQILPDGTLHPTARYFPNALRALGEALGSERWPWRMRGLGERELDVSLYDREIECDWTSGSFLLTRREALESAGFLDERYFIYSEETDLCLRIKQAGWRIVHLPSLTIIHHAGKAGVVAKIQAQDVYTRMQYARKHFSPAHRAAYWLALFLRFGLRAALAPARDPEERRRLRDAYRFVLETLLGRRGAPYQDPPPAALRTRQASPPSG
ncbi:MAG: glycosyltransferase family 2 protein [Solirubrobacteraceae bacterium]